MIVKDETYWKAVYDKAFEHLAELHAERDTLDIQLEEVNKEIVQVEKVLSALTHLTASDTVISDSIVVGDVSGLGLADACRKVLQASNTHRTARGIRDSLEASGYDLKQHKNHLASIHGVLKRLVDSGEVELLDMEGKLRYRWKPKTVRVTGGAGLGTLGAIGQAAEMASRRAMQELVTSTHIAQRLMEEEKKRKR
jgi:hypothetical protein